MKTKFKKILTLSIIFAVALITKVDAAELTFGESTSGVNTLEIPVTIKTREGEAISQIKFGCEVTKNGSNYDKVSCKVTPAENIKSEIAGTYVYNNENTLFPDNATTTVATIVVTNENYQDITDIKVSLKNASIDGTGQALDKIYARIGAKAAEKPAPSSNSKFSDVSFSNGTLSPAFNPDTLEYTVYKIPDTVNSVKFNYKCESCNDSDLTGGAKVEDNKITLNQGVNKVTVYCVAEDGSKTQYTFNIIRGESSFNSAKLAKLSFDGYTLTPKFDPKVTEYSIVVPNKVNGLVNEIDYQAEDEAATITPSGLDNFQVGEDNKITIKVDNSQGDESITYTITVKRLSDNEIQVIKYKNKEVTFKDSEGTENTLSEDDFRVQYPEEFKKIISKEYKFDEDGNIIIQTPKDEKEDKKEDKEEKNNKTIIIVIIIITGLIVIGVSGYFIFRKKKPSDDDKNNKDDKNGPKDENKNKENDADEEIDETGIEEEAIKNETKVKEDTMDIDEALSDLMSTKRYEFKDEE